MLGVRADLEVRVVGSGPETPELDRLRALPGVTVENRWVPEGEVGKLLAWSDALVLSHREASQSGVAATALAARRRVVATRVGGLAEQLCGQPLARMCAPTAASLAAAVVELVLHPPDAAAMPAPAQEWDRIAASLLDDLVRALPPK